MALIDLVVLALLGTAGLFAIIELGLSAYLVSVISDLNDINNVGDINGNPVVFVRVPAYFSSRVDFLLFCSIWTMLIVIVLFVLPITFGSRVTGVSWAAPVTLALNGVTMLFWLAGFAAYAAIFGGIYNPTDIWGAVLAFGIMLWLLFLAIFIINILTATNVLVSERFGFGTVRSKPLTTSTTTHTTAMPATTTHHTAV